MRSIMLLAILPIWLSGCVAATGSCDFLPLPVYQEAEEKLLANELTAAEPKAIWPWRMVDYYRMRDAVAACRD